MGQGVSSTSGQGLRTYAFDSDYYSSDNTTATIKWVGAGDGSGSYGVDYTPIPILQYYNVYLEDTTNSTTQCPVRIEKDWPLYASFSGLSSTASGYNFIVDALYGPESVLQNKPLGDNINAEDAYESDNIMFTSRIELVGTTLTNFAAATGDPYLTTFTGDIYKLPNDNNTYRMIDNFCLTDNPDHQFFVNTQMYMLPDDKQSWLDHYLNLANQRPEYRKYFDQNPDYIESARAIGGSFMKISRIQNGQHYLEFDMETLEVISQSPLANTAFQISKEHPIETGLEATHSIDAYTHEGGFFKCIRFYSATHREVVAKIFSFSNPQLRTAINVGSPLRFSAENSHGALLCPQKSDYIQVPCLDSAAPIVASVKSPFYRLFQETFIKNGDMYQIEMVNCEE